MFAPAPRRNATFSRNSSISGSCLLIRAPRVWAQELGCLAMGLSSPLPCLQTARPSGCKGARRARKPATNPCSATGASGIHPPLLRFSREFGQSRREREIQPKEGTIRAPDNSGMYARFPRAKGPGSFPLLSWAVRIRLELTLGSGGQSERRAEAAKKSKATMPQADRRSRFLALIWAMRMGPSENSPSPAFRVNSRK
jgi:hypothetical protein